MLALRRPCLRPTRQRRTIPESVPLRTWSCSPGLIRVALAAAGLLAESTLIPAPLASQSSDSGTVAFLVQDGLRYTEQRRFSEAINALEEAWERDPSNPIVAEHLALAYLYERIPPGAEALEKAQELMRFSLHVMRLILPSGSVIFCGLPLESKVSVVGFEGKSLTVLCEEEKS